MLDALSSLHKRIISAAILAPVVVGIIILGGWYFIGMIMLASMISLHEFAGLASKAKKTVLHTVIGGAYLSVCFASYIFIRFGFDQGAWFALAAIVCVWASDIGAYAAGKSFGGMKLAPKISPNKTWAGMVGAMGSCALALVLMMYLADAMHIKTGLHDSDLPCIFIAGLVLGAVGQAGDLLISFYKRRAGAKDTGTLIPGHGGLLDRIDALLLVSPVFLGIVLLCL